MAAIQEQPDIAGPLVAGRWPATAVFFLNGLALSTYIVRVPSLKVELGLSDGYLGLIGLLFAVAALTCMQFVGPLVARVGSGPILRVVLLLLPVLLAVVGWVGSPAGLAVAVTALGAVHGTTDAAMNSHAVTVERLAGRSILNGCHAGWSVSAVVASLTAAVLAGAGVSTAVHLPSVAIVLIAGGLLVGPRLLPGAADRGSGPVLQRRRSVWRGGWTASFVTLGVTGTALMVCESAALGWGGVFMTDSKAASLGLAATAVMAYTAGQTGMRLVGDSLSMRFGAAQVFRIGGLVAVFGLATIVVAPRPLIATAGFAVMGLGMAVLLPLTFSAVGRADAAGTDAATLVSRFTTFTYGGILLGPAMIGWAAETVGLTWTLAALIPVLFTVATLNRLPGRAG